MPSLPTFLQAEVKALGNYVPCSQDEVILQATMKEPFVGGPLCDRHLLMV